MDELTMDLWAKNQAHQRLLSCISCYYRTKNPMQKTAAKDTSYMELMLIYDEYRAKEMVSLLFPKKPRRGI